MLISVHDVVDAGPPLDRAGLAAGDAAAGERLQLQRDMLRDMAEPRSVVQPPDEAAALLVAAAVAMQAGQQIEQASVKPGMRLVGHSSSRPRSIMIRTIGVWL
jgi:hypothetical protein